MIRCYFLTQKDKSLFCKAHVCFIKPKSAGNLSRGELRPPKRKRGNENDSDRNPEESWGLKANKYLETVEYNAPGRDYNLTLVLWCKYILEALCVFLREVAKLTTVDSDAET